MNFESRANHLRPTLQGGASRGDVIGQALAYVYHEEEPVRRAATGLLTRDEAHRIAANLAKVPDLLAGKKF